MEFSILPYHGSSSMPPWPSLAGTARMLSFENSPEDVFFFDSAPLAANSSSPVIVLVHGLGDEADSWRHLIPLLSTGGFRVLAPDLPGFGRSVTRQKISLKNHAAAVLKLIDTAMGRANPVFLAGNSMGAVVAEIAAFQRPGLVRGLVLIDGSIPGGPSNPGVFALAKFLFSRKWYRAYRDKPGAAWASLYPYYADLDGMPKEDREFLRLRVMARVESPAQERAFFASQRSLVFAFSLARAAGKIKKYGGKILLLWGEKDRIIPLSRAETFMAIRGDIELKIIPGAGHLPQQENPEETARCIRDWCACGNV
jgi:pimeloyl-ACP methyl ester carboxylesterase